MAAAEALGVFGTRLGSAMAAVSDEAVAALEAVKLDKLRPVREAALGSITVLKAIQGGTGERRGAGAPPSRSASGSRRRPGDRSRLSLVPGGNANAGDGLADLSLASTKVRFRGGQGDARSCLQCVDEGNHCGRGSKVRGSAK